MAGNSALLVSFSIAWGDTKQEQTDYNKIYEALNEALVEGLGASDYWRENTSIYVLYSNETPRTLLARVWSAAKMRSNKDRLLVLRLDEVTGASFGNFQDKDLFSLLPSILQVPAAQK